MTSVKGIRISGFIFYVLYLYLLTMVPGGSTFLFPKIRLSEKAIPPPNSYKTTETVLKETTKTTTVLKARIHSPTVAPSNKYETTGAVFKETTRTTTVLSNARDTNFITAGPRIEERMVSMDMTTFASPEPRIAFERFDGTTLTDSSKTFGKTVTKSSNATTLSASTPLLAIASPMKFNLQGPAASFQSMASTRTPTTVPDLVNTTSAATAAPDLDNTTSAATAAPDLVNTTSTATAAPDLVNTTSAAPELVTTTSGTSLQHVGSLLDSILLGYNRRIRPRTDQAHFVAVFSDFVPNSIIEFNTQQQRFSVMGYFKMDWRDDFLTWDPDIYGGIEDLRISVQSIWIPKLVVDKSFDGDGIVGDMNTDIALFNYNGYVRWFPEGIYSVACRVTIRFFPFDIQNCTFAYYIRDEDNSTINLKHDGTVDLTEYIENAEWKLNSLTATREQLDNKFVVTYTFTVERRGGFAMFTLVVPVLMLSTLSGATFLIPIETGEKCSFSVTIFMAYGIFETVVIDTLPHNSMDISYFILYLTCLLIVSVLLTFYTILQAKIFDAIGDREFTFCRGSNQGDTVTWGTFLRKLDTIAFAVFFVLILGFTVIFVAVMGGNFDFL